METNQSIIHGGYDTKDRINYLLREISRSYRTNDGKSILWGLEQLYSESYTLMKKKKKSKIDKLRAKVLGCYNKKKGKLDPELYTALKNFELALRDVSSSLIMPKKSDPGTSWIS